MFAVNVMRNEHLVTVALIDQGADTADPLGITRHVGCRSQLIVGHLDTEQVILAVHSQLGELQECVIVVKRA